MGCTTFEEIKSCRLSTMNAEQRAEFDEAYEQSRRVVGLDEKVRSAPKKSDGDQSSDDGSS